MDKAILEKTIDGLLSITPTLRRFVLQPMSCFFGPLNHKQFVILATLESKSPLSMTELANLIVVSNQQLTALVAELVDNDYLERSIDKSNRRVTLVSVTKNGIEFLHQIKKLIAEQFVPFFDKFTEEEIIELNRCTSTIVSILEKE
ncbi:MAG: MarR family transcriptional regulator [Clostridia bacterium]|nr:MarR family transcriptional regulator [Clostridia bacterium]